MLTFCTSEPFGMFVSDGSGKRMTAPESAFQKPISPLFERMGAISAYLHGDLQDEAGFDVPAIVAGPDAPLDPAGGEAPCEVWVDQDKPVRQSLFIYWPVANDAHGARWRGLIVAQNDERSLRYARQWAKVRPDHL